MSIPTRKLGVVEVSCDDDVVRARQTVRTWSVELGFRLVDQTKLVTAASELSRNILLYAGRGTVEGEVLTADSALGLRVTFEDHGPGIEDVELAMRDGHSSRGGLGLGLGGSRRLVNEFEITSRPGEGTRVRITKWKPGE